MWATAGTWNDVFGIEPQKLVAASGGVVTDLKRGSIYTRYHFIGFDFGSRFNCLLASRSS